MPDAAVKQSITRGLRWVGAAATAVAALDVVAVILILRYWLSAEDYGTATVVVTLFGAIELAAELGLSAAVIQRDDHTDDRLSTVFWLNLMAGAVFYLAIWLAAPALARAHHEPIVETLFKVYGINLLLKAAYGTHQALLKRQLRFKELSIVRIVANLTDFTVRIVTAATGYGLWCLVLGTLARSLVYAIGVPIAARWRPRFVFRPRDAWPYLAFGARASAGEFLFQLYSNLDYQVVGIFFGSAAVGVYRAAYELVLEPVRFVSGAVTGVAFPAFARLRTDRAAVIDQLVRFVRQNLIVVLSLVGLILVTAEQALAVIIKPEYAVAASSARVLAIVGVLRALSFLGPPLQDGLGRPELSLRYQLVAATVLTTLFAGFAWLLGDRLGYFSVALAWAVGYPIAFFVLGAQILFLLELRLGYLLARIADIVVAVAVGTGAGLVARRLVRGLAPPTQLAVMAAVTVAGIGLGFLAFAARRRRG
ncbi:MAG TPA: oligosaccharide flippase family protein [Kofleriaceae bacterium]|nr:oligosaccharide flippase family protein [Kofleriaceae bacterium]